MRTPVCLAAAALIIVTGCASPDTVTPAAVTETTAQAMPADYGHTTCAQWANLLTAQQRHDSALDMLTIARDTMSGAGGPSAELAATWETNLTEACPVSVKNLTIAGAAELLYRANEDIYSS